MKEVGYMSHEWKLWFQKEWEETRKIFNNVSKDNVKRWRKRNAKRR